MDDDNLCFLNDLLTRRNIHRSINDTTPHVNPDSTEVWEGGPIAACVTIDIRIPLILEAFATPNQFGTIPYCTSVDARLLHHRSDACATRVLALAVTYQTIHRSVPTAVVVAHSIVLCQTRDEWTEADTFVVVEAAGMCVLIKKNHCLRVLLARF